MSQEQNKDMSLYFCRASAASFMQIPGSPIGYWVIESFSYWLLSSGKRKTFEPLANLHHYNEGTLARMRTEYVTPITAKLATYTAKLKKDLEASTCTAEKINLEKEIATLHNQQTELATFDETLRHYSDQRTSLDLDDGVKVNCREFGYLLTKVKAVSGGTSE